MRLAAGLSVCLALTALPAHAQDKAEIGGTMMVMGGGILMISLIVDIAHSPHSAMDYNARRFALRPMIDPRQRTAGLGISYALHAPARDALQGTGGRKRPGAALAWSTVATFAPAAVGGALIAAGGGNDNHTTLATGTTLLMSGVVIGPATGHWYSERASRSIPGLAIRVGAAALGFAGAALLVSAVD